MKIPWQSESSILRFPPDEKKNVQKPKQASAGSNCAGLGQLSNTVWDRSWPSVALIERSHRSNPKPWNPKHVNRDEERSFWLDSSQSCVQVQQLSTAEEAQLAASSPEVTAAYSSFNPHFNYSCSACLQIQEEIPDYLHLKSLQRIPGNWYSLQESRLSDKHFVHSAAARLCLSSCCC